MTNKSLLILTQYYPPEIGAPQNRLHELAIRLQKKGLDVEVLTAMPNYPKMEVFEKYRGGKIKEEQLDGIQVYRSGIYVSNSKSIVARLLNYFSFVWTSYWRGRKLKKKYDFLMVESPPLFLGYSAMALSKRMKAKLIFNVSDLWPESAEKMEIVNNNTLLSFAYKLEEKCYRRAWKITGQTMGIVQNIQERFSLNREYWLPNGVNPEFYNPEVIEEGTLRDELGLSTDHVIYFYGGIIGHAQGLETVIHAAKKVESNSKIAIILQGAGPVKEDLMALANRLDVQNVYFREPVQKSEMPAILKSVDAAVVPLRKLLIFEGAIPSKIFEALSMELPLLLGVDGEARTHFEEKAGAAIFCEPENIEALAAAMIKLADETELRKEMGRKGRSYVSEHFNRDKIANGLMELFETA
jgi:glycosyltransferase involved in cell wall biosynthesis